MEEEWAEEGREMSLRHQAVVGEGTEHGVEVEVAHEVESVAVLILVSQLLP